MHVHVCVHTHICARVYTGMLAYMDMNVYVCVHTHVCTHVCAGIFACAGMHGIGVGVRISSSIASLWAFFSGFFFHLLILYALYMYGHVWQ